MVHRYLDIFVGEPCVEQDYIYEPITPHQCRLRDMTYVLLQLILMIFLKKEGKLKLKKLTYSSTRSVISYGKYSINYQSFGLEIFNQFMLTN